MRALAIELRHGPATYALPLFILLGYLAAESQLIPGVWLGDNITSATLASVQLTGPLAAGLAAWFGTREARRGTASLRRLGARSSTAVVMVEIAALILPALVATLLVLVTMVVRATSAGMYGGVHPMGVMVALAGLLVHVCVGYAAGLAWPRPLVAPLVAFALYLYVGLNLDFAGQPFYLFSPVTVEKATAYFSFAPGVLWWQALWLLGLAGVIVAVVCLRRAPGCRQVVATVVVLAVAVVGGLGVLGYDGRPVVARDDSALACSTTDALRLCTHPAFNPGQPQLVAAFTPALDRLAATPAATPELFQTPRRRGDDPRQIHLDDLAPGFASTAVTEFIDDQLVTEACFSRAVPPNFALTRLVADWIVTGDAAGSSHAAVEPDAAAALAGLDTLAVQQAWLSENFDAFRACALTADDMP